VRPRVRNRPVQRVLLPVAGPDSSVETRVRVAILPLVDFLGTKMKRKRGMTGPC
jgi:hypothetical protein